MLETLLVPFSLRKAGFGGKKDVRNNFIEWDGHLQVTIRSLVYVHTMYWPQLR